eukprot:jgi/Hompol1/3408/HPOL_006536-RA
MFIASDSAPLYECDDGEMDPIKFIKSQLENAWIIKKAWHKSFQQSSPEMLTLHIRDRFASEQILSYSLFEIVPLSWNNADPLIVALKYELEAAIDINVLAVHRFIDKDFDIAIE